MKETATPIPPESDPVKEVSTPDLENPTIDKSPVEGTDADREGTESFEADMEKLRQQVFGDVPKTFTQVAKLAANLQLGRGLTEPLESITVEEGNRVLNTDWSERKEIIMARMKQYLVSK